jgi:hypothetical protein
MPKPMPLFGKIYPAGITVSGKSNLLGKEGEVLLNVTDRGIYGSFSVDPIDLKIIALEGIPTAKKPNKKLEFALSLDTKNTSLAGLYCDANISISAPPFTLARVKGKVYLVPSMIRITGLETSLAGVGKVSLDVQAGLDLNKIPTNLNSLFKFKAVLKPDSIKSLSDSFQGAFNKMGECFK